MKSLLDASQTQIDEHRDGTRELSQRTGIRFLEVFIALVRLLIAKVNAGVFFISRMSCLFNIQDQFHDP